MQDDMRKQTSSGVKDETKFAQRVVKFQESIFDFLDLDSNDSVSFEELQSLVKKQKLKDLQVGKSVLEICNQLIQSFKSDENSSELQFVDFVNMFEKQIWRDIQLANQAKEKKIVEEGFKVVKRQFYFMSNGTDSILVENKEKLVSELARFFGVEIPDKVYLEFKKFDLDGNGRIAIEEFEAAMLNGVLDEIIQISNM